MRRRPARRAAARVAAAALIATGALDAARSLAARGLAPRPERLAPAAALETGAAPGPGDARGRYLVESGTCGFCHTPVSESGVPERGPALAGGTRIDAWPFGVYVAPNLTPDVETGSGRLDEAEIAAAIRAGHLRGRALDAVVMPSVVFASLPEADARAIARHLLSLEPVARETPPPLRYGVVETLLGKGLFFAGAVEATQIFHAGRVAGTGPAAARWLPALELSALAAALAAGLRAWRPRPAAAALALSAAALLAAAGFAAYRFPAIPGVRAGALRALFPEPALELGALAPAEAARVRRGRGVYHAAGCAVCHGLDGAEPVELRWRRFGTRHTGNLTALSERSDREIERAVRAGVTPAGAGIPPRAMPWPRFARLDDADMDALIRYLRALPPVACARPAARGPSPGDPAALTARFRSRAACRATPP